MAGSPQGRREAEGDLSGSLITLLDPTGATSEAYRTLRTSLLYSLVDLPRQTVVVTSAGPREGKSTTCANLGVVLAQADKRTLILDCDLRRPTMHNMFNLRNFEGVVNVLAGERGLKEVSYEILPNLKVVTSGPIPPNPAEILSSERFAELLSGLREEFDFVLMDTPPVQLVSDPLALASQADGVLLVLDVRNTRKRVLKQTVRRLQAVGANVLGTVMNNAREGRGAYYYGGYRYE
jgi:capsular exopolysaccharide synthesis family protein